MSATPRYAFQSPSVSDEKGAYRMRPPRSSRPARLSSEQPPHMHLHVPYRRTRRLALLVTLLTCGALACFACAYWLFATRYSHISSSVGNLSVSLTLSDAAPAPQPPALHGPDMLLSVPPPTQTTSYQLDIALDALDEPDGRLDTLRTNHNVSYLAYLPHSGLHNQRIALENALTLARLLNRTLLVPPARLGTQTLRYVRSSTLARMLWLSDKRQDRNHCAHLSTHIPWPAECVDYMSYTLVSWAGLVDLRPIEAQQSLLRVSNGTGAWIEEKLGVRFNETFFLADTEPYEYQFVDTPAPVREGDKYLNAISIDSLAAVPQRLIQLGTLFGSSRLRLRKGENKQLRGEVRRHMVFANVALKLAAEKIGEALGKTYIAAHVRVGDGHFQDGARRNVRDIWWKLVRDFARLDTETALELERYIQSRMAMDGGEQENENGKVNDMAEIDEILWPSKIPPDLPSLRVPHPTVPPLPDTFLPKRRCRNPLHTTPSFRRLNVPLFIATDAQDGLDNSLLGPLIHAFPCTFFLGSFEMETAHLKGLRNGYDGVYLAGFLAPIVDALVMGNAWAVVGTEGSTFSRYVEDVLWRVSHGWEIVGRG